MTCDPCSMKRSTVSPRNIDSLSCSATWRARRTRKSRQGWDVPKAPSPHGWPGAPAPTPQPDEKRICPFDRRHGRITRYGWSAARSLGATRPIHDPGRDEFCGQAIGGCRGGLRSGSCPGKRSVANHVVEPTKNDAGTSGLWPAGHGGGRSRTSHPGSGARIPCPGGIESANGRTARPATCAAFQQRRDTEGPNPQDEASRRLELARVEQQKREQIYLQQEDVATERIIELRRKLIVAEERLRALERRQNLERERELAESKDADRRVQEGRGAIADSDRQILSAATALRR